MHEEKFSAVGCVRMKKRRVKVGRERWREEETSVIKRRCVNPFYGDAIGEFSPMDESGTFGNSCGDLFGDSCGCSMCELAVSSCVPVVADVSVSPSSWVCLLRFSFRVLIVSLLNRSTVLTLESVKLSLLNVKEA